MGSFAALAALLTQSAVRQNPHLNLLKSPAGILVSCGRECGGSHKTLKHHSKGFHTTVAWHNRSEKYRVRVIRRSLAKLDEDERTRLIDLML